MTCDAALSSLSKPSVSAAQTAYCVQAALEKHYSDLTQAEPGLNILDTHSLTASSISRYTFKLNTTNIRL